LADNTTHYKKYTLKLVDSYKNLFKQNCIYIGMEQSISKSEKQSVDNTVKQIDFKYDFKALSLMTKKENSGNVETSACNSH